MNKNIDGLEKELVFNLYELLIVGNGVIVKEGPIQVNRATARTGATITC